MFERVITGGQTGADQGGLRAARACGVPTAGWAPRGWLTEAGPTLWLADWGLVECPEGETDAERYQARRRPDYSGRSSMGWTRVASVDGFDDLL
jgi:Circularly permutated YpsA SLOG family